MEVTDYLRFGLALVFVLGLIGLLATFARRAGFGFPIKAMKPGGERRIFIVEVTPLDGRRRLVLVRRDNVEHLLLLGPTTELVIENNIPTTNDFLDELQLRRVKDNEETS